jgi:hypothetical protein
LCLVCTRQLVEQPDFADGRLQLVCEACAAEAKERFRRETNLSAMQLPLLLIPGGIGALLGALVWAGVWFTYDWALGLLSGALIPTLLLAALYAATGILVAKVVAFFPSRVRNRGQHFGAGVTLLFCAFALVFGELALMGLFCLKALGVLPPPSVIARVYFAVLRELSVLYVGGKIIAAATALYLSYSFTLPQKVKV